MSFSFVFAYLTIINLTSGIFFIYDKQAARKQLWRVSEFSLHLLEFLGGFMSILVLIYLLPHKSRKPSYLLWTWFIMIVWGIFLISNI